MVFIIEQFVLQIKFRSMQKEQNISPQLKKPFRIVRTASFVFKYDQVRKL